MEYYQSIKGKKGIKSILLALNIQSFIKKIELIQLLVFCLFLFLQD